MNKEEVLMLENQLSFQKFTHQDAFDLACQIIKRVKTENLRRIGIRVVLNNVLVLQWLMDGKEDDSWLKRKQKTVETFQHSSYYVFLENQEKGIYEPLRKDTDFAICGGGFPIIVDHQIIGSFCVSGLAHQDDHQLIVDAFLQKYKEENGYDFSE